MSYSIIRFSQTKGRKTIKTGLTIDEVKEHCNCPSSEGEGWFDGFEEE